MKNARITASWNRALKFQEVTGARQCVAEPDSLQECLTRPLHKAVKFVAVQTSDVGDAKNMECPPQKGARIESSHPKRGYIHYRQQN